VLVVQGFFPVAARAKFPLAARPKIDIEFAVEFVIVSVFGPRLPPTATLPNPRVAGLEDNGDATPLVPEPLKSTICGLNATPLAVSVTVSAPLIVPFEVGEKKMLSVQWEEAPRVTGLGPQGVEPPDEALKLPPVP
jgi:hypothetical protein